jgi:hypothetical protein
MQGQAVALMAMRQTPCLGMEIFPAVVDFVTVKASKSHKDSTGIGLYALINSIKSTYFLSVSTDFHKRPDLFWEQRVVSSNLTAPTNRINRFSSPFLLGLLIPVELRGFDSYKFDYRSKTLKGSCVR